MKRNNLKEGEDDDHKERDGKKETEEEKAQRGEDQDYQ